MPAQVKVLCLLARLNQSCAAQGNSAMRAGRLPNQFHFVVAIRTSLLDLPATLLTPKLAGAWIHTFLDVKRPALEFTSAASHNFIKCPGRTYVYDMI
jgi:hypothetical protein